MQEDSYNTFLKFAVVEKSGPGMYLIYMMQPGGYEVWYEYHLKQKKITGGCGIPLTEKQKDNLDNLVEAAFFKILKEKSDAKASYWAEYVDYEEVYGLDNGWN